MGFSDFISPPAFFISFFVGIFLVYILAPTPDVIFRYPTPENAGKIIYQDHANTCYTYNVKEVNCDKPNIIDTPLQETNNHRKNNENVFTRIKQKLT